MTPDICEKSNSMKIKHRIKVRKHYKQRNRNKSFSQSYRESTHLDVELVIEFSRISSVQLFSRFDLFSQLGIHRAFNRALKHLEKTFSSSLIGLQTLKNSSTPLNQ